MPTATKPAAKPQPRVKVVSRASKAATDQPLRRSIPAADGLDAYQMQFAPGVPMVIDGREIDACSKDLANGNLAECSISPQHLLALLEDFADVERDRQIAQLRDTVGRLVEALRTTGQFRQPEIDSLLKG
jgi:hypothetical protein